MNKRKVIKFAILAGCGMALSACDTVDKLNPLTSSNVIPPCPRVQFLKGTDTITTYQAGPGRDITDILFEADMKSFDGECEYIGEDGVYTAVKVTVTVTFDISKGPADKNRASTLSYFVALPEFFPKPEGRQVFERRVGYPENRNTMRIVDEEVEISIPLSTTRKGPSSKVYIGFVLTPEQLKFNRQKSQVPGSLRR